MFLVIIFCSKRILHLRSFFPFDFMINLMFEMFWILFAYDISNKKEVHHIILLVVEMPI